MFRREVDTFVVDMLVAGEGFLLLALLMLRATVTFPTPQHVTIHAEHGLKLTAKMTRCMLMVAK
ncbi:hypothetical protein AYO49_03555 [Verrucomicrobiaceae bacterium SCGC AG-212-N21]|nr:hypothetical protein AYO49_03555 [Verrucomicrobiaceae bacterium SCGC AG-212-N21]